MMAPSLRLRTHVLSDMFTPGLAVVFCGTAPGTRSARLGQYYAGPGNRFWRTLQEIGLTGDRPLEPAMFAALLDYGIGLTDIAKSGVGNDKHIARDHYDGEAIRRNCHTPSVRCRATWSGSSISGGTEPA